MDTAQWPQEVVVKPIEERVVATCPTCTGSDDKSARGVEQQQQQRKPRPQEEQPLSCPRCHSTNTKFCYYNNYSLTQPRYFCKTCRRYWTRGGSLRNIPVGGGSRKAYKRSSNSSSSPSSSSSNKSNNNNNNNNPLIAGTSTTNIHPDLNLQDFLQVPGCSFGNSFPSSALELLNSFAPMAGATVYSPVAVSSGFSSIMQEFKPMPTTSLGFDLDAGTKGHFAFEDLKIKMSPSNSGVGDDHGDDQQVSEQADSNNAGHGYWTGIIGGGSW